MEISIVENENGTFSLLFEDDLVYVAEVIDVDMIEAIFESLGQGCYIEVHTLEDQIED